MSPEITLAAIEKIIKSSVSESESNLKSFINTRFESLTETMLSSFDQVYQELDFNKRITILESKMEVIKSKLNLQFN